MDKDTDFLPWIMGGLLAAAGAIAAVVATQPPTKIVAAPTAAPVLAGDAVSPAVVITRSAWLPKQPTAHPVLPPGQVWQCVVDGKKTFSDSPCGENASIRQLNPVNGMDPSPPTPPWGYSTINRGYAAPPDAQTTQQNTQDDVGHVDGAEPVYLVNERARRENRPLHRHDHRPTHHD